MVLDKLSNLVIKVSISCLLIFDSIEPKPVPVPPAAVPEVSKQQRHDDDKVSIVQQHQQQPRDLDDAQPAREAAPQQAAPAPLQPADAVPDSNNTGIVIPNTDADVAAINDDNNLKRFFVMTPQLDPILHAMIVVLAVLCYLLLRKILALLTELRELQQQQQQEH